MLKIIVLFLPSFMLIPLFAAINLFPIIIVVLSLSCQALCPVNRANSLVIVVTLASVKYLHIIRNSPRSDSQVNLRSFTTP